MFFLTINILLPFTADDISYAFIWDGEHGGNLMDGIGDRQRVESFTDILISQWSHYFHWGGRTIAHIIVQFFSWVGKAYFDVLNVLVFCALVFLIFKIGTGLELREMNKKYLLFILAALYFLTPDFLITTVWMTGSINYLWMTTLEFLFILPFVMKYRDKNFWSHPPSWSVPLMAIIGLLAGWSIEPGASVTMFITFLCVIEFWREKTLQSWESIGFIFLTTGFLILILAPGNFERSTLTLGPDYDYSFDSFVFRFKSAFVPIIIRESILFLPIIYYFVTDKKNSDATKFIVTFLAASILALCTMMFVPLFPQRAGFPSTVFLIPASLAALKEILPSLEIFFDRHLKFFNTVTAGLAIFCIFHISACTYVYYNMHLQLAERWKIINANRDAEELVVPHLVLPSWSETVVGQRTWTRYALIGGADLYSFVEGNKNIMFAQYYGLKKIRIDENLKLEDD